MNASDIAKAVRAVESNATVRELARGKKVSIDRVGPWTVGDDPSSEDAGPDMAVGVALKVELPDSVDLDPARWAGVEGETMMRGITSLTVLYDPSSEEIVSMLPAPEAAPALASNMKPSPWQKPLGADAEAHR